MDLNHPHPKSSQPSQKLQPAQAPTGSIRRRLWELGSQCHGPIVGTCWDIYDLKRMVTKTLGKPLLADDYDVHCGTVSECASRNRLSEMLQRDLDYRHAMLIRQYRAAKKRDELALLWKETMEQGDAAGALWAALTHPQCDVVLQDIICRNLHMYQLHAVTHFQLDQAELRTLAAANTNLVQELARNQERSARCKSEKSAEINRLSVQLADSRALLIQKDSCIALLNRELTDLQAEIPELKLNLQLKQKLEEMAVRQAELEALVIDLRKKPLAINMTLESPIPLTPSSDLTKVTLSQGDPRLPDPSLLQQKTVLCVGGRSGSVASYRDLIERVGGRFAHHDGGREDNANVLNTSLAAADLVICQTGCISHNAYWRVKDFCKRTGKRCVFVENPSTTALARSLENIAEHIAAPQIELHQTN